MAAASDNFRDPIVTSGRKEVLDGAVPRSVPPPRSGRGRTVGAAVGAPPAWDHTRQRPERAGPDRSTVAGLSASAVDYPENCEAFHSRLGFRCTRCRQYGDGRPARDGLVPRPGRRMAWNLAE
ncbi:hypothetical protein GCM10009665_35440 [Kitasatospora nipponensis]|uniref:Uncharacterized protein n=1 Tax=Kitasatospora nipponensis TaxID=258049 RepID=A0ABN1WCG7_9ACTN